MLYGRDAERAAIGALLDGARDSRGGVLVLRGEPGVGKTALLEDARDRAGDMYVLSARGVESESELPFAGLDQLLRPALDRIERLPAPQASALRGALGLEAGTTDERYLVFAACLTLLSELSERRPLLCLVDDAHWLDPGSAGALVFVARRLSEEQIALLFTAREGEIRSFEAAEIPSLLVEGLNADAAEALLSRVAESASPAVRALLVEQTRGNALALVELPAALSEAQLAGVDPLPEALPLTRQLEAVFLERVRRLPDDTQRLLLIGAADDSEDIRVIARAAESFGVDQDALVYAEAMELVTIHGSRFEFRHPLVRSAVYQAATSTDRRGAHRALADALERDEQQADRRAWHLAAASLAPDRDVVQTLEQAAARAAERAGHLTAAKALVRGAELTMDSEERGRCLAGAARAARIAGADDYALLLANQARPLVDGVALRAEIAYATGVAEVRRGRPLEGLPQLVDAARGVAQVDAPLALELLIWATCAAGTGRDAEGLAAIAAVASSIGEGDDDTTHTVRALSTFAQLRTGDGRGTTDGLDETFAWAGRSEDAMRVFLVGLAALIVGDHRRLGELMNRAISLARARGELGFLAQALTIRAAALSRAQRFDEAAHAAREAVKFADELGAVNIAAQPLSTLALVAAIQGREEETRGYITEEGEVRATHGLPVRAASTVYPLAMLDLAFGRWAEAVQRLVPLSDPRPEVGDAVLANLTRPDLIEAAVRAGQVDMAAEALSTYESWTALSDAGWPRFRLAACRGLLADGDEASAHFKAALETSQDAGPFDLARVELLYGEHLRRERRRTDSRSHLRAALEGFERLRAEPWAERARAELRATGETTRKRDPSTLDDLTPQELQIARLVAQGLANKEVAAQLYLSPRTIDYHLRNVFVKLGIKSRTQLARFALLDDEAGDRARAGVAP